MIHEARREELLDLVLGLLGPEQARALEAHAAGCPDCREELAALRRTRELVAGLPPIEAPEQGTAALLAAARQAAERAAATRAPRWAAPRWLWGGTLGLAGAAAVAILVLQLSPAPVRRGPPEEERESATVSPPPPAAPAPASVPAPASALGAAPEARVARKAWPEPAAPARVTANLSAKQAEAPAAPVAEAAPSPPAAAAQRVRLADEAKVERFAAVGASRPAPSMAAGAATDAGATAAPPGCRLEQQRQLLRDAGGQVVGRVRTGRYPAPGGEVPLRVEERYGPDGRLRGATVSVGGRNITVGAAEIEAGRLEPLPGVVLARTASEAAEASPRCDP